MTSNITVLLPIAGDADRFWPITDKHFLPFLGKPLIHYSLSAFQRLGFKKIILIVSKQNKNLAEKLDQFFPQLALTILVQQGEGIGGAIQSVQNLIDGPVIVYSSSDVVDVSLFEDFAESLKREPDALVVAKEMKKYFPGGYLKIKNGVISAIIEKPGQGNEPSSLEVLLFYYFKNGKALIEAVKEETTNRDDQFERGISRVIAQGLCMKPLVYKGFWGYLKYPWDTLSVMEYFLDKVKNHQSGKARIHKSATLVGSVQIEDEVEIHPGATIIGPTYLGYGTIVGNNALIRQSHIGKQCVIGFGSEVARSYIGEKSWFHTNYVGDSVIGRNVSMGAGGVLANLRLDEGEISSSGRNKLGALIGDHVRIGVNTSIMPGIKIGNNVAIGPGIVVDQDIPNGKMYRLSKSSPSIKNNAIDIAARKRSR